MFKIPPPAHDSVTGTEGDLAWAENFRLRANGASYGRQYVAFNEWQAYPELVLKLERKPEVTQIFRCAEEQEVLGKADKEMAVGTQIYVQDLGILQIQGFEAVWVGANTYTCVPVDGPDRSPRFLKLRDHTWHVVITNPGQFTVGRTVRVISRAIIREGREVSSFR